MPTENKQTNRETGAASSGGKGKKIAIAAAAVVAVVAAVVAIVLTVGSMNRRNDTDDLTDATQPPPVTDDLGEDKPDEPPVDEPPVDEPPVDEPPADEPPADEPPVDEPPADEPPEPKIPTSPMTGIELAEDISVKRPWACMFDNIRNATPQTGITAADIIFEALAEGGVTRLMGIFEDFDDMEILGGVRSSREYFAEMAYGLDAIYIHGGGSPGAYDFMIDNRMDRLDGVNGPGETFHRDEYRRTHMGMVHSLVVETNELEDYVVKYGLRRDHYEGYVSPFTFNDDEERTGDRAVTVTARFGSAKSAKATGFTYDPDTKQYLVSQYNAYMGDTASDDTVKVRNIIALFTKMNVISGDDKGRREAELTGTGTGKFIVDGVARDITWSRATRDTFFTFTYDDGAPVNLGTGKTYILIMPTSAVVELGE